MDKKKFTKTLKIPPQSIESEKAYIGALMLRQESLHETVDMITPIMFYADRHRLIFETILELYTKSIPVDMLSLSHRLKEKKLLEQVGGNSYLTDILEAVPSSTNVKHYAEIIQKKWLMRKLIDASEYISGLGYAEAEDIESLLDQAEKKIFDVTNFSTAHSFVAMKDILGEAFERLNKLHGSDNKLRGVSTGFKSLDNKLSGFQNSDLIILAARPSMGKTSLALDIARKAAIQSDVAVGIFSLEMSSQQLIDRMLAAEAQVDSWKLRTGRLSSDSDFDRIRDTLDVLSKAPIYIDDEPGKNILKMRSVARKLKSEKNLGMIIVDYLQLMTPTNARNNDNVVQQVTEISRSLKSLARELDVPVLALSQLSRAVESRGGKPRLSDLRDSGSIEQDADVVMFIHQPDKYKEEHEKTNIAEILIEKHRNGPTGRVELFFDAEKSSFRDLDNASHGSMDDF
jgi:replicative DNA helicase